MLQIVLLLLVGFCHYVCLVPNQKEPKRPVVLSVYIDSKQYVHLLVILCFLTYNMIYAIVKNTCYIKKLNMTNHAKLVKGKTLQDEGCNFSNYSTSQLSPSSSSCLMTGVPRKYGKSNCQSKAFFTFVLVTDNAEVRCYFSCTSFFYRPTYNSSHMNESITSNKNSRRCPL